jgi:hypothetical protein
MGTEIQIVADFLLKQFDQSIAEFEGTAAFCANQVVMVFVPDNVLIHLSRFAQVHRVNELSFDQQIKDPIDSGAGDSLIFLFENIDEFVGIEMVMSFEHGFEHGAALWRSLQVIISKKLLK